MSHSPLAFSIIVPVRNDHTAIGNFLKEIHSVFIDNLKKPGEIVVVDDASSDDSVAAIEKAAKEITEPLRHLPHRPSVELTLITQPQPTGVFQSIMKGLIASRGEVVVSIDSGNHFNSAEIPRLIEKLGDLDMVCGARKTRTGKLAPYLAARFGNSFRTMVAGKSISDAGCLVRAMRRPCIATLQPFEGRLFGCEFLFHAQLLKNKGLRVGEIPVTFRPGQNEDPHLLPFVGKAARGLLACVKIRGLLE
jgi:dolichol-phosphate mannosyltransferase